MNREQINQFENAVSEEYQALIQEQEKVNERYVKGLLSRDNFIAEKDIIDAKKRTISRMSRLFFEAQGITV